MTRLQRAGFLVAFASALLAACGDDPASDEGVDAVAIADAADADVPDLVSADTDLDAFDAEEDAEDDDAPDVPSVPDVEDTSDTSAEDTEDVGADTIIDASDDANDDVVADVSPDAEDTAPDVPDVPTGPPTAAACLAGIAPASGEPIVDYDALGPTMGTHCGGTNHQDIEGVEHVVFVGDSITVGSPPTAAERWYRNVLADRLSTHFGITAPGFLWRQADVIEGRPLQRTDGAFSACAKWGARTDDISNPPHRQMQTCAPTEERDRTTLFIMTVGGNDIFAWAQDLAEGRPITEIREEAESAVADLEASIEWAVSPGRFPNGVYVVFASNFLFIDRDSAQDFSTCPGADLINMDTALVNAELNEIAAWVMSEYMRIAVETGTDLAFMGERFCGHGHMRNNPDGRCYRGPGAELYTDITCMHPSAAGHQAIADVFMEVITE